MRGAAVTRRATPLSMLRHESQCRGTNKTPRHDANHHSTKNNAVAQKCCDIKRKAAARRVVPDSSLLRNKKQRRVPKNIVMASLRMANQKNATAQCATQPPLQ